MATTRYDLKQLVERIIARGALVTLGASLAPQFGTPARQYLGATLLPERLVQSNSYTERGIRLSTIIANAGPRYGPAQIKDGAITASFDVSLGHSDIAREMSSEDLDAIRLMLTGGNQPNNLQAVATIVDFADIALNRALVEFNEVARWQSIVNAYTDQRGDNGYISRINYLDPTGHRVTLASAWTDPNYDPWPDLQAIKAKFAAKGKVWKRFITSSDVVAILLGNPNIMARTGLAIVGPGGNIQTVQSQTTIAALNNVLTSNGMPVIETYDLTYTTSTGTQFFLPRNVVVATAATETVVTGTAADNANFTMENALGYVAIGTAAGQGAPGRVIELEYFKNKPPRIEGEAWQTSAVVPTEPEAMIVLKNVH